MVGAAQGDDTLARAFQGSVSEYYARPRRQLTMDMVDLARRRGQIQGAEQVIDECVDVLVVQRFTERA